MNLRSIIAILVLFAVVGGLVFWLRGVFRGYEYYLGWLIALFFIVQVVGPFIFELRARLKEINGVVSVIESKLNESKDRNTELLERLTAIENRLDEIRDNR